jgi:hypothetical protein
MREGGREGGQGKSHGGVEGGGGPLRQSGPLRLFVRGV